jgi:hypothetical protein
MSTRQTLDVLQSYASLLSDCGDSSSAGAVRALVSALSSAGDTKIKTTVAKVSKLWAGSSYAAVSPSGLSARLLVLQDLLAAGGAKSALADIRLLTQLLDAREAAEPERFEFSLREAILAEPPQRKTVRRHKRDPLSEVEVRQWADKLTATSTDQAAFESELSAILAIPGLSVPELRSIAGHYLGYEAPKGKAGILKKIRTRQKQDAIEAGRQSRIERIAV